MMSIDCLDTKIIEKFVIPVFVFLLRTYRTVLSQALQQQSIAERDAHPRLPAVRLIHFPKEREEKHAGVKVNTS